MSSEGESSNPHLPWVRPPNNHTAEPPNTPIYEGPNTQINEAPDIQIYEALGGASTPPRAEPQDASTSLPKDNTSSTFRVRWRCFSTYTYYI